MITVTKVACFVVLVLMVVQSEALRCYTPNGGVFACGTGVTTMKECKEKLKADLKSSASSTSCGVKDRCYTVFEEDNKKLYLGCADATPCNNNAGTQKQCSSIGTALSAPSIGGSVCDLECCEAEECNSKASPGAIVSLGVMITAVMFALLY